MVLLDRGHFMHIPLSLLLCREFGGTAVPVARITDQRILRIVTASTARAKRQEAAGAADGFSRARLNLEAEEIESATK